MCVKVAPSAQRGAVVVLHIVRSHRVNEPSDAICADETPYAILEQESPLTSCISFFAAVGPRARHAALRQLSAHVKNAKRAQGSVTRLSQNGYGIILS